MTLDVLVLGGGAIGLSIAVEIARQGGKVRVLTQSQAGIATTAAAGMLAPEAEGIPQGPFRDLCLASRSLWPQWAAYLEDLTGEIIDYWPSGILCPREVPGGWDRAHIEQHFPDCDPRIQGALWYPEDSQVDPRKLYQALYLACGALQIPIQPVSEVALIRDQYQIKAVQTPQGLWQAQQYVVCAGSWSAALLDLPVQPVKGQMLALIMPRDDYLDRVVFGPVAYLVPRHNGRLVVGATEEAIGFSPGTTEVGTQYLLEGVYRIFPEARAWTLVEAWYGYRPTTPDRQPILGRGSQENLWIATGHHRNGILLSPQTALLLAQGLNGSNPPAFQAFSYDRFGKSLS